MSTESRGSRQDTERISQLNYRQNQDIAYEVTGQLPPDEDSTQFCARTLSRRRNLRYADAVRLVAQMFPAMWQFSQETGRMEPHGTDGETLRKFTEGRAKASHRRFAKEIRQVAGLAPIEQHFSEGSQ